MNFSRVIDRKYFVRGGIHSLFWSKALNRSFGFWKQVVNTSPNKAVSLTMYIYIPCTKENRLSFNALFETRRVSAYSFIIGYPRVLRLLQLIL